jgi:DNA polymerase
MTIKNDNKTNKEFRLKKIQDQIQNLECSPLYNFRIENEYKLVFGEGDPDAKIMFIGEAPGAQEAKTGKPFVGRAGKLLDSLLDDINLDRNDVYITNIVKDRPPSNRTPRVGEIKTYAPFLLEQIRIIKPKIIATLGRLAMQFILRTYDHPQKDKKIGELHGEILEAQSENGKIKIIPLYHPAAVFYNRDLEIAVKEDFQKLSKFIETD